MHRPDPALIPELPAGLDGDSAMDAKIAYDHAVAEAFGFSSVWSAGHVDFSKVAFPGRWRVRYDEHWGSAAIVSPAMVDPTWLDLFAAADWAIARSGDSHHIFIESFAPDGDGSLILWTGS